MAWQGRGSWHADQQQSQFPAAAEALPPKPMYVVTMLLLCCLFSVHLSACTGCCVNVQAVSVIRAGSGPSQSWFDE